MCPQLSSSYIVCSSHVTLTHTNLHLMLKAVAGMLLSSEAICSFCREYLQNQGPQPQSCRPAKRAGMPNILRWTHWPGKPFTSSETLWIFVFYFSLFLFAPCVHSVFGFKDENFCPCWSLWRGWISLLLCLMYIIVKLFLYFRVTDVFSKKGRPMIKFWWMLHALMTVILYKRMTTVSSNLLGQRRDLDYLNFRVSSLCMYHILIEISLLIYELDLVIN